MSDVLAPFIERPGQAALLLDFDGTLSPIVDVPAAARPLAGAGEVLDVLAAPVRCRGGGVGPPGLVPASRCCRRAS